MPTNGSQELAQLSGLTRLDLDDNCFRHLPSVACRLPRLAVLSASNNGVAYLPDALAGAMCGSLPSLHFCGVPRCAPPGES